MNDIVFHPWHWWIIIAIALFAVEIFAPGFVLACLAFGAIGGCLAAVAGANLVIQLIVVAIVSVTSLLVIRPYALKRLYRKNELKTNVDSLIGRKGRVSQAFDNTLKKGRVAIDGDDWMAYVQTEESELPKVGDVVSILEVNSNTIIVKPLNKD